MKKTFYPVLCSKDDGEPSGYDFHGYRITNSGSGWVVRGGGQRVSPYFATSDEAEEFILDMENDDD